jgi:hypothetical protein
MATADNEPKSLDQILNENAELKNRIEGTSIPVPTKEPTGIKPKDNLTYVLTISIVIFLISVIIYVRINTMESILQKDTTKKEPYINATQEVNKDYYLNNPKYNCRFVDCSKCGNIISKKYELGICENDKKLHKYGNQTFALKYDIKSINNNVTLDNNKLSCCKNCGVVLSINAMKNTGCAAGASHESDSEYYNNGMVKI